jgi:hypothetical protein
MKENKIAIKQRLRAVEATSAHMSKRSREEYGGGGGQAGMGSSGGGSWAAEYHTVLLLKASEFAKVIGRQGKIVNELRQRTGAHIKGVDLVGEDRMVTIGGTGTQIEDAFEVLTSYSSYCFSPC